MSEASGATRPGRAPRAPIAICGAILAGLTYTLWTAGDDSRQALRLPASFEVATSAAEAERTPSGSLGAAEHARAISPETLPTETAESAEAAAPPEPTTFDAADLKRRLDAGEDLFLLDVRRRDELETEGAIDGYVHIPLDELEARMAEIPKDKPLVVY